MHADSKRRQFAHARNRIAGGWCANHQARCREDPLPVSALNGFVDAKRTSKIVGGDDQPLCFGRRHFVTAWTSLADFRRQGEAKLRVSLLIDFPLGLAPVFELLACRAIRRKPHLGSVSTTAVLVFAGT